MEGRGKENAGFLEGVDEAEALPKEKPRAVEVGASFFGVEENTDDGGLSF